MATAAARWRTGGGADPQDRPGRSGQENQARELPRPRVLPADLPPLPRRVRTVRITRLVERVQVQCETDHERFKCLGDRRDHRCGECDAERPDRRRRYSSREIGQSLPYYWCLEEDTDVHQEPAPADSTGRHGERLQRRHLGLQ